MPPAALIYYAAERVRTKSSMRLPFPSATIRKFDNLKPLPASPKSAPIQPPRPVKNAGLDLPG
jgi:hypothetical protein